VARFCQGISAGVTRVAFLFHPELGPFHSHWQNSVDAAAATLGVETTAAPVRATADVERAISTIAAVPNGGMVVEPDAYTHANRRLIIELAAQYRLPAIYGLRQEASEGGLVSYGPEMRDLYRRSASYVDRILSPQTCQCKNRLSMSSWSISRPPNRSVLVFPRSCLPPPMK